jgi:phosphoadenosine phosphosulfate reductase
MIKAAQQEMVDTWGADLAALGAEERVRAAYERYGEGLVLSTSFGVQSAVMLHLVTRVVPGVAVVFVDTGYLFAETYRYAEQLTQLLELNVHVYQPLMTAARQEALYGRRWEGGVADLEAYNLANKVEPMARAMKDLGARAWLSGLRRAQARTRQDLRVVQVQKRTVKVHPILEWTERDVYQYMERHGLPAHPLWEQGYVSVGDWHSTRKLEPGMAEEETRFGGLKRECGLHEANDQADWQI